MPARVKPLTQTKPDFTRRFSRPSAYEKANQGSSTSNGKILAFIHVKYVFHA